MATTNNSDQTRRPGLVLFLSVSGSVASLAALVIVLIDKVAASRNADPQLVVWQIALCFASLMAIGATVTLAYYFIYSTITESRFSVPTKTIRVTMVALVGLFGVALFVDGVFASLYWRWWLGGLFPVRSVLSSPATSPGLPLSQSASAAKSIRGTNVTIYFTNNRSKNALAAKSQLESHGALVTLMLGSGGLSRRPNTIYYRNVSVLEAAVQIEKLLGPLGVTDHAVISWSEPTADIVIWLR